MVFTWRHQILKFKTGRPTEIFPSFKERLPKNISLRNSLARYRAFCGNRTISISEFSSCVTSGERIWQSCSVSSKWLLWRFSKVHKRKQTSLLAKVNSRCFFLFPATMFVSLRSRTQIWRLHNDLYKLVWNIMSNNSSTEYRTDLRLGQSTYLFIVFNVPISWLHSVDGFRFLFWWRDSENRQFWWHCFVVAYF